MRSGSKSRANEALPTKAFDSVKLSTEFLRLAITQSVAEISSHDAIAFVSATDLLGF